MKRTTIGTTEKNHPSIAFTTSKTLKPIVEIAKTAIKTVEQKTIMTTFLSPKTRKTINKLTNHNHDNDNDQKKQQKVNSNTI